MSAVPRPSLFVIVVTLAAVVASGCASDDGTQPLPSTDARSETSMVVPLAMTSPPPVEGGAEPGAYCDRVAVLEGERPESYVGSSEHQADIDGLAVVAPESVRRALVTYSEFLSSGAVDPAKPDSNLTENWPTEVQTAIEQIVEFNADTC
jgi:hypothetical protein